jgi:hypothetical protein
MWVLRQFDYRNNRRKYSLAISWQRNRKYPFFKRGFGKTENSVYVSLTKYLLIELSSQVW